MKLVSKWFSTCVLALAVAFGASAAGETRQSPQEPARPAVIRTGQPGAGAKAFFFKKRGNSSSDEPKGGHKKGSRPSTEDKHDKGNERRIRDQGGEKKDSKRDDGRNAWKKRRGGG